MPIIDCIVVLDSGVGAFPGGLGHTTEQFLRLDALDHFAGQASTQAELAVVLHRLHELVGDADRVVGVLVLHRADVGAGEVHVEPGVAEDFDLLLFARLGLDELFDVRVIDIEHDHLRRPPGGPAGLDGARGGIRATHERDRTRSRTA